VEPRGIWSGSGIAAGTRSSSLEAALRHCAPSR
jgi:hypothetical protein